MTNSQQCALALGTIFLVALGVFAATAGPLWSPTHLAAKGRFVPWTVEIPTEPLQPIPERFGDDVRKVELGRRLFNDPRLSQDGKISCATCHRPDRGGADDVALTPGLRGRLGEVNVPTVFNSRFNLAQFWDGRVTTLEEQVDKPLHNPIEMGSNWPEAIARLAGDRRSAEDAQAIYDSTLSPEVVRDAIATYERSLLSINSRFDSFLCGNSSALTAGEQVGYRLFKNYGCAACHQGSGAGGNMYQRMGLFGNYFGDRPTPATPADRGRFNVTGNPADMHVFKVPSLRNVVQTAPYFHDGSAPSLESAIAVMARYQLGRNIPLADIELIAAFLATLSDASASLTQ